MVVVVVVVYKEKGACCWWIDDLFLFFCRARRDLWGWYLFFSDRTGLFYFAPFGFRRRTSDLERAPNMERGRFLCSLFSFCFFFVSAGEGSFLFCFMSATRPQPPFSTTNYVKQAVNRRRL